MENEKTKNIEREGIYLDNGAIYRYLIEVLGRQKFLLISKGIK